MAVNLTARVESAEDGMIRMSLRGGRGNPVFETWHLFNAGPPTNIHAEVYDRDGELIASRSTFVTASAALSWLADGAWDMYSPDSIQVPPAKVDRLLKALDA